MSLSGANTSSTSSWSGAAQGKVSPASSSHVPTTDPGLTVERSSVSDRQRLWAEMAYGKVRPTVPSMTDAVEKIIGAIERSHVVTPDYPPADRLLLMHWAEEGDWEKHFERQQIRHLILTAKARPEDRVPKLRDQLLATKDMIDAVYDRAMAPKDDGKPDPDDKAVAKTAGLMKLWLDLLDKLAVAEEQLRKRHAEVASPTELITRRDERAAELMDQYEGHGPQYKMLIDLAVGIQMRMTSMENSGQGSSAEYNELAKILLSTINQLQKHTESTKSESVSREVNEMGVAFLQIVQMNLSHDPIMFKKIVADITARMEGRDSDVPSLPAPDDDVLDLVPEIDIDVDVEGTDDAAL